MRRFLSAKPLFVVSLIIGSLFISFFTISYTNSPPRPRTGAPNESNCTSCHSGTAITSGTNFNSLKMTSNMTNSEYTPGTTYKMNITYTESGRSKFGFQTTVLKTSDNTQAGDLIVTSSTTTVKGTATVSSKTRQYISQKSSGTTGSGKITWSFEWDAPSTNVGDVKFYVAMASTNSNNSDKGDKIILKSFTFKASSTGPKADFTMSRFTACVGDTVILNASKSKNSTGYAWTISGANPAKSTNKIVKAVWSKPGSYPVKLITSKGASNSSPTVKNITIQGAPDNGVTQTGKSKICEGDSISLKANSGVSWLWNNGKTTQEIYVSQTDTYNVEVTRANGCKATSFDFNIKVADKIEAPVVKCSEVTTESIKIAWDTDPLVKEYEVSTDSGKTWAIAFGTNNWEVTGLTYATEQSFWIRGTDDAPCLYSELTKETCKTKGCFNIKFDVSGNEACKDAGERSLVLNNLNLERFGIAYNSKTFGVDTTFKFNPVNYNVGNHDVVVSFVDSSALSCPSFDTTLQFSVRPIPIPEVFTVWYQGDEMNKVCELSIPKELKGNTADANGPEAYIKRTWTGSGVSDQGGSFVFDPAAAGKGGPYVLTYSVTNIYGCGSSAMDEVSVDSEKKISISATTDNGYAHFSQTIDGAKKWLWNFGDGDTSSAENPTHIYSSDGTYTASLITNDGDNVCSDVLDSTHVTIVGSSIKEFEVQMALYPIPFSDYLTIEMGEIPIRQTFTVYVYDPMGQLVYQRENTSQNLAMDLSALTKGIYVLRVSGTDHSLQKVIVKE